jgi:hypothetical protein
VRLGPLGTSTTIWPIVPAQDDQWWWVWSSRWNKNWQGKPKYLEKTCLSVTLSSTNPKWSDLGSNAGRCGGKPATNRLSYGTASCFLLVSCLDYSSDMDCSLYTPEDRTLWKQACRLDGVSKPMDGYKWSASCTGRFIPGGRAPLLSFYMRLDQMCWRSGNFPDLYSGSARFEPRPEHRPPWQNFPQSLQ